MNLARFGLLKTSSGVIAPDGTVEEVEISEEEARQLPPDAYSIQRGPLTTPGQFAAALGIRTLISDEADRVAQNSASGRRGPGRGESRERSLPANRPIPPENPVKYVKHQKRTSKEFVEEAKQKLGIVDWGGELLEMDLPTLLLNFPSSTEPNEINKAVFARNIVWHFYREIEEGRPPEFVRTGCNIRTIFYVIKPLLTGKGFADVSAFYSSLSEAFKAMVEAGLVSYLDFKIMDDRKPYRFMPHRDFNTDILLLTEKKAFIGRFSVLASKYGVMAQVTEGQSTLLMTDTLLTEMVEAGFDMSRNLTVLSFCDFDPVGTSIPFHFNEHLKLLGYHNTNYFTQYGDQVMKRLTGDQRNSQGVSVTYKEICQRRPCLDIVNPHDLDRDIVRQIRHVLDSDIQDNESTADWAFITGGVTGTGRNKEFAISSEQFLPYLDDHLEKKILPLLRRPPEAVGRRSNFRNLHKAIREYIGARAERDARRVSAAREA